MNTTHTKLIRRAAMLTMVAAVATQMTVASPASAAKKPGVEVKVGAKSSYPGPGSGSHTEFAIMDFASGDWKSQAVFRAKGDDVWVRDEKADGKQAVAVWSITTASKVLGERKLLRRGICINKLGKGKTVICKYNFPEKSLILLRPGTRNGSSGKVKSVDGPFISVKTGAVKFSNATNPSGLF